MRSVLPSLTLRSLFVPLGCQNVTNALNELLEPIRRKFDNPQLVRAAARSQHTIPQSAAASAGTQPLSICCCGRQQELIKLAYPAEGKGELRQSGPLDDDEDEDGGEERKGNGASHAQPASSSASTTSSPAAAAGKKAALASASASASASAGDAGSNVGKLDIRVGRITQIAPVEQSSKLYVSNKQHSPTLAALTPSLPPSLTRRSTTQRGPTLLAR